jgi:hypothetical protein
MFMERIMPPHGRRRFIRTHCTSGAVATAGGLALSRVDGIPAEAIKDWQGLLAADTDPRRWILACAILAPNPHNMQPWLANLREPGVINVRVDLECLLPETDPFGRQLFIGLGCFLELAVNAASRGLTTRITCLPTARCRRIRLAGSEWLVSPSGRMARPIRCSRRC